MLYEGETYIDMDNVVYTKRFMDNIRPLFVVNIFLVTRPHPFTEPHYLGGYSKSRNTEMRNGNEK